MAISTRSGECPYCGRRRWCGWQPESASRACPTLGMDQTATPIPPWKLARIEPADPPLPEGPLQRELCAEDFG